MRSPTVPQSLFVTEPGAQICYPSGTHIACCQAIPDLAARPRQAVTAANFSTRLVSPATMRMSPGWIRVSGLA